MHDVVPREAKRHTNESPYDFHQSSPEGSPLYLDSYLDNDKGASPFDSPIKPLQELDQNPLLKSGEDAINSYLTNLPKLAASTYNDIDTKLELLMLCKGTSLKATEVLRDNTPAYVSVIHTELMFRPSNPEAKQWELRYDTMSGEARAMRFDEKTSKMVEVPFQAIEAEVSTTLRAAKAIKCFRDGNVDAGRAELKTLLEDAQKKSYDAETRRIIESEAALIYKPARIRAFTKQDFDKVLEETSQAVKQQRKK